MRSRLLLFASICTFNTALWAQTVPHSTHAADQVVQGPCYIFATTAALESRALQNPANNLTASNANFNEWQSYSTCALGGRIWGGLEMIKATLNQAKTNGVSPGDHANPIFDNCPNPNDPKTPCIADFSCVNLNTSWCEEDKMYLPIQLNTSCNDADVSSNRTYTIDGGGDFDYKLLPDANGDLYKREPVISVTSITNLLSSGHGVIAYFSGWKNTAIDHAVYIYKYAGGFFYYKDSWPGAATAEGKISSLSTCYNLFYITGTIVPNSSGNNTSIPCDYDIQGDGVVAATGTTTYTLSGGTGAVTNIVWQVPTNVTLVSGQGTKTLNVRSDNCSYAGTGVISVSYTNGGSTSCSDTKTVSVQGAPTAKPTGIEVWGFDWSMNGTMGQTCPNTTLELHPIDTNPDYPTTAYQWSITGATILAGQNTGSLLIRTSSASRSNQVYAVRANKNHCGWSGWRHLSATSSSANCFGGGVGIGFLRPSNTGSGTLDFTDYFYQMPASEVVEVEVISLTGRQLYVGRSTRHSPEIGIQQLPAGWVFLRLYDPIGDNYATVRHQIVY